MARALCLPLLLSILLSRSLAEDEPPLPFAVFNTTRVNCPSTVTEFTALTELILEGPRDPADTDGSGILYRREWECE